MYECFLAWKRSLYFRELSTFHSNYAITRTISKQNVDELLHRSTFSLCHLYGMFPNYVPKFWSDKWVLLWKIAAVVINLIRAGFPFVASRPNSGPHNLCLRDFRCWKLVIGNRKSEIGNQKSEIRKENVMRLRKPLDKTHS